MKINNTFTVLRFKTNDQLFVKESSKKAPEYDEMAIYTTSHVLRAMQMNPSDAGRHELVRLGLCEVVTVELKEINKTNTLTQQPFI